MKQSAPKRLPSGAYHMVVRDPLNPERRISITEPTAALVLARVEHYRALRRDLRHGAQAPEDVAAKLRHREVLTVKEVWSTYVESFPPERADSMKGLWARHFGGFEGLTVYELTQERMADWEKWEGTRVVVRGGKRYRGCGKATIKTVWAMLRAAIRRRIAARELREVPWGDWAPSGRWGRDREEREALRSIEEVAALLHQARLEDERLRGHGLYSDLYARICVLAFCGLRQGELGALGWDDLEELAEGGSRVVVLHVRFQVRAHWKEHNPTWERPRTPCKRGSSGSLRLHTDAVRALDDQRAYLRARRLYRPDGPMFPDSKTGTWRLDETCLKPERLRELTARAGVSCDLLRWTTHGLRHTMVTLETLASGDLRQTQRRTRHRDLGVLTQYMHAGGRGLPASALPSAGVLPPGSPHLVEGGAPRLPVPWTGPVAALPAPPAVHQITAARGAEIEDERADLAAVERLLDPERVGGVSQEKIKEFAAAYERWVARGRREVRPPEVTRDAERARSAGYLKTLRRLRAEGADEGRAKREAQLAGVRSKKAYLANWARIARRLGEPVPIRALAKARARDVEDPDLDLARLELGEGAPASPARPPKLAAILPFRRRIG